MNLANGSVRARFNDEKVWNVREELVSGITAERPNSADSRRLDTVRGGRRERYRGAAKCGPRSR